MEIPQTQWMFQSLSGWLDLSRAQKLSFLVVKKVPMFKENIKLWLETWFSWSKPKKCFHQRHKVQRWSLQRNDEDMDEEPGHRKGDEEHHEEGTPAAATFHQPQIPG